METRGDNVTGICSSVLPTRRRFCVVGKNISVLAPSLPASCTASRETIAMADFNGAENLCAGFISASSRRLLFISAVVVHKEGSKLIWIVCRYLTTRLIDVGSCKAPR